MKFKKFFSLGLSLLMVFTFLPFMTAEVFAEPDVDGVDVNETNFPDKWFRWYVGTGTHDDDYLDPLELQDFNSIQNLHKDTKSLQGIQYLSYLYDVICSGLSLTELDLGNLKRLDYLDCSGNQLSSLKVSGCPELVILKCNNNKLEGELSLYGNEKLEELDCSNNKLTQLITYTCRNLKILKCHNNSLTDLSYSEFNRELVYLDCHGNNLSYLYIGEIKGLRKAYKYGDKTDCGSYVIYEYEEGSEDEIDTYTLIVDKNTTVDPGADPPVITSLVNTVNGPKITWSKCDRDDMGYYVLTWYDNGEGNRVPAVIAEIPRGATLSYIDNDAQSGEFISYWIEAVGKDYVAAASEEKGITYLAPPKVSSVVNTVSGPKITWSQIPGADKYIVMRKEGSGSFKEIKTVSEFSTVTYTDTTAASGKKYTYAVKAAKGSSSSSYYSAGKTITYLQAPKVSAVANTVSGPKVTWNKIEGATGYIVMRKEGSGSFKEIKTVSGNETVTYTDTTAASGKKYTYAVKANGGNPSSYYSAGKTITYLAAPKVSAVANTVSGPKVTWNKIAGATGYVIMRKEGSGAFTAIKTVSGNATVTYTDTTAASGKKYTYAVKANGANPSSYYSAGKTITYLTAPKVSAVANTVSGTKVTWNKITGATGYIILRKEGSGSFTAIKTVSGNTTVTYTDTTAASGKKYTYAVKANGANPSSYYSAGKTITYLAAPKVSSVTNTKQGPKVTWGKVTGATGYVIMRKEGSGSFTAIKTVSGNGTVTYTDTTAVSGKTYTYGVKANGTNPSSYYTNGKSIKCSK